MSAPENRAAPPVSRTAVYVAAGRALGAREADPRARNPDDLAERLLGDPSMLGLDHPVVRALSLGYDEAMQDFEVVNNVRLMTVRTRFIDEALERAIDAGATQVLVLGAGFDSHAYRCRELLASARVFEVDRPATQAFKRARAQAALGPPPSNLTYVAVDFEHEDLRDTLVRQGYDLGRRTFIIMEGVTMYLREDAVRETLSFVAAHAPGSSIVFDFVYDAMIEMLARIDPANLPPVAKPFVERFLDLIKDEPWRFGIAVGREREFLGELGLELCDRITVGDTASVARYLTRADGTQVGGEAIAKAMQRAALGSASEGEAPPGQVEKLRDRMREQQRLMAYQLVEASVAGAA